MIRKREGSSKEIRSGLEVETTYTFTPRIIRLIERILLDYLINAVTAIGRAVGLEEFLMPLAIAIGCVSVRMVPFGLENGVIYP